MKNFKLNIFELALITGIILLNVLVFIITKDTNIVGIVSSITGVICVVMTAKGHISCYYWGIVNIATYGIISYQASFFGEVMLNGIYYLPMQFIGIYMWKKYLDQENIVKTRGMNKKQIFITLIISLVAIWSYGLFLQAINGNLPFIDSTTNVLSILAMYLSVKRFKEQWLMWIMINIISIYMWSVALINGETNSLVMIIMWSAYLINAVYGYINWTKLERRDKNV